MAYYRHSRLEELSREYTLFETDGCARCFVYFPWHTLANLRPFLQADEAFWSPSQYQGATTIVLHVFAGLSQISNTQREKYSAYNVWLCIVFRSILLRSLKLIWDIFANPIKPLDPSGNIGRQHPQKSTGFHNIPKWTINIAPVYLGGATY